MQATLAAAVAVTTFAACDRPDYTAAREYWAQPDSVIIGLGRVSDIKALSRDEVWVADLAAAAVFSVSPPDSSYLRLGVGDREPVEIVLPAKLAVEPDIGLSVFDAERLSIDLYTFSGEYIRSFEPGFIPAVMSFSREPLGYTFGIAEGDSISGREAVVIRTDLQGTVRDTLLSRAHGPEALRGASAASGETFMSPSPNGMWVWTRNNPNEAWNLAPRGHGMLPIRDADASMTGLLADRRLDMLWAVHVDSAGTRLSAYDARDLVPEVQVDSVNPPTRYLGTRTTPANFAPWVVHDGIAIGLRRVMGTPSLTAYDLNVDRLERAGEGRD